MSPLKVKARTELPKRKQDAIYLYHKNYWDQLYLSVGTQLTPKMKDKLKNYIW